MIPSKFNLLNIFSGASQTKKIIKKSFLISLSPTFSLQPTFNNIFTGTSWSRWPQTGASHLETRGAFLWEWLSWKNWHNNDFPEKMDANCVTQWKIAKTSFNCKVRLTVGFRWLAVTNLNQTILSAKYKSLILINQMFVDKYTWSGLICPRNVSSSSSGFLSKCKRRGFPVCDNAKSFDSNSSRRTNPLHS